jgi:hypothetical protein
MGIKKFETNYFLKQTVDCNLKFDKIYVDCTNYYIHFLTNIDFFKEKLKSEPSVCKNNTSVFFFDYILSRIIPCVSSNGIINLIFDSQCGRKIIKWAECINRKYQSQQIEPQLCSLPSNCRLIEAKYDADYYIYDMVKNDIVNMLKPINVTIDQNDEILSNIAIFSRDTDFLCFFPNKQKCCVMTFQESFMVVNETEKKSIFSTNKTMPFTLIIRNFKINQPSIQKFTQFDISINQDIIVNKFLGIDNYYDFVLKLIGMCSPNDYLTGTFWSKDIFKKILDKHEFVLDNNYESNLQIFRSLATVYWSMYIQQYANRKELYTNSLRILNFDGNLLYQYDFVSDLNVLTNEYKDVVEKLLFDIVNSFDGKKIKEYEKSFKNLLHNNKKQTIVMKDLLSQHLLKKNSTKLDYVFASALCLKISSLLCTFFLKQNNKKTNFITFKNNIK